MEGELSVLVVLGSGIKTDWSWFGWFRGSVVVWASFCAWEYFSVLGLGLKMEEFHLFLIQFCHESRDCKRLLVLPIPAGSCAGSSS